MRLGKFAYMETKKIFWAIMFVCPPLHMPTLDQTDGAQIEDPVVSTFTQNTPFRLATCTTDYISLMLTARFLSHLPIFFAL